MVATRWGDVLCELWAEEMLGWHGVWSGYEGRVTCVALRQGWMVATRRDDVMRELWAEETPEWHGVWSGRLFVPARVGWRA
jgi:hypothetical protein